MVLDRVHRTSRISSLNRTYVLPGSLIIAADMSGAPLQVSASAKDIALPAVVCFSVVLCASANGIVHTATRKSR